MNSGKEYEDLVKIVQEKVQQVLEKTKKSNITSLDLELSIKFSKASIRKANELGIKIVEEYQFIIIFDLMFSFVLFILIFKFFNSLIK